MSSTSFLKGFSSLQPKKDEIVVEQLPVLSGSVPTWLSGILVRNGPALYDFEQYHLRHWFDGMAMLHRFTFNNGQVSYANRFLRSRAFTGALRKGELVYREFATDPQQTELSKIFSLLFPTFTDNACVNVTKMAGRYLAMSETPHLLSFDPRTLKTTAEFRYSDDIRGETTTAHPHYDYKRKTFFNFMQDFGLTNYYKVFKLKANSTKREMLTRIKVKDPAYMHSFAMTENYIVLVEFPLLLTNVLAVPFTERPILKDYDWLPQRGARFLVISKDSGQIVRKFHGPAFFAFHHINAFEQGRDLFIDLACYDDATIVDKLYFSALIGPGGGCLPDITLRRFQLHWDSGKVDCDSFAVPQFEFARINYARVNAKDYQYLYSVSKRADRMEDFLNQLSKVDVHNRTAVNWCEDECYPGEPVFVARPGATAEDDGVAISVVMNSRSEKSFVLILNANDFSELARLELPHIMPFGIHGAFFEGLN